MGSGQTELTRSTSITLSRSKLALYSTVSIMHETAIVIRDHAITGSQIRVSYSLLTSLQDPHRDSTLWTTCRLVLTISPGLTRGGKVRGDCHSLSFGADQRLLSGCVCYSSLHHFACQTRTLAQVVGVV
jgi:hypothetical protein